MIVNLKMCFLRRWLWRIKAIDAFIDTGAEQRGTGGGAGTAVAHAAVDKLLYVWLVHHRLVLDLQGVRAEL